MQYMLMCCIEEERWNALDPSERDRVMGRYHAWIGELETAGKHLESRQLQSTRMSTTLRTSGGRVSVTDGPFAETKEQFGGYHLVDCADLDEAIAMARKIPTLDVGGVIEVRPLVED